MASLTSSSRRSSSSYRSSSRYSTSSSYRSEGSLGGSSDSLDPHYESFLDSRDHSGFQEGPAGSSCLTSSSRNNRSSYGLTAGPVGGAVTGRQSSTGGGVRCLGDNYLISADISQFEPHDIVVMAYKQHVVIHAQKVLDDGSVSDTFTHRSLLPEDMDPLSLSGSISPDGTLAVSLRRTATLSASEPQGFTSCSSEADL